MTSQSLSLTTGHSVNENRIGIDLELALCSHCPSPHCPPLDSQDSGSLCFCFRWLLIWFKSEFFGLRNFKGQGWIRLQEKLDQDSFSLLLHSPAPQEVTEKATQQLWVQDLFLQQCLRGHSSRSQESGGHPHSDHMS